MLLTKLRILNYFWDAAHYGSPHMVPVRSIPSIAFHILPGKLLNTLIVPLITIVTIYLNVSYQTFYHEMDFSSVF